MVPPELKTSIIQRVLAAYGLAGEQAGEPQKGYRNTSYPLTLPGGEKQNLIFYKSEPGMLERIRRTNAVSDFAAASGLPTRRTLGRIIRLKTPRQERFAALYNYLPGHTIPWEAYTKDHIKLLGMGLGVLHASLAGCPAQELPKVTAEYSDLTEQMKAYFSDAGVRRAMAEKLQLNLHPEMFGRYGKILEACNRLPGQQALHMDFVRGNVLFKPATDQDRLKVAGVAISGILDLEKTAYGHPLFDIARTLAFLLVDCKYKTPAQTRKYFLQSGYIKRGGQHLPGKTYPLLKELTNLFLLHDFYKFLRHNPYESLHQNEHFLRTSQILLGCNLLKTR